MGAPMARNLLKAGYEVSGYNRSPAAVRRLEEDGGVGCASVAELVAGADAVVTVLPDSPDVEEVVLGPDGVLAHAAPGLLLVDCSTIRPETTRLVAARARERGVAPLDAPVSGGEKGAVEATLSIMVGGLPGDVERARRLLEAMGRTIVHVGPDGAGQTVKAANQLLVAGHLALLSEAIVLLGASGVDPTPALRVLNGGLAGSRVIELKGEAMLERQFVPGFRIDLHHKDLGIAVAAAREAGVALPMTGLVAQLMAASRARGDGDKDHAALVELVRALAGGAAAVT
ncbi:2-hydroxy-3-oxopropionate reductase [Pseudonocardia sp. CNS-004]|nr:2-hydroxy-3-oxopropionate reductase [Pseudonocardia sp. CNS-004]